MKAADAACTYGRQLLAAIPAIDRTRLHLRRFRLPGVVIEAWFSSVGYAELCERNIATVIEPESAAITVTLYLLDSASLGWAPPPRWEGDVYDRQAANAAYARAGLRGAYLHAPRVWQFYSEQQRLGVQLVHNPAALPDWESGGPLRSFLHWAYGGSGRFLCHAASLGLNGRGILLVGAGGAGKSGTTLAGIAHGLDSVGDDYCLLESRPAGVTAYPLFRLLKQDAAGTERVFGAAAAQNFGPLNWQRKYEIHESQLPRSPFVPRLDIRAVLVPRVAGLARSVVALLPAGAAMRAFAPSSTFQLPDGEHAAVAFAASVCRRLPCSELRLSQDGGEIAATLRQFLEHECQ